MSIAALVTVSKERQEPPIRQGSGCIKILLGDKETNCKDAQNMGEYTIAKADY